MLIERVPYFDIIRLVIPIYHSESVNKHIIHSNWTTWLTDNLKQCYRYRHLALTTNQRWHFATASRRTPSWTCRSWEGRRTRRTWHLSGSGRTAPGRSGRPTAGSAQTSSLWWCRWRQERSASEPSWTSAARLHTRYVIDCVVVLCPTRNKIGQIGHVSPKPISWLGVE